jgi:hypothetical protein
MINRIGAGSLQGSRALVQVGPGLRKAVTYFVRFHTSSAFPPPDAAVLVYFISSPVIVTDRL